VKRIILRFNPEAIRVLTSTDLRRVSGGAQIDRTQSGLNCPLAQERK
jgi:hypothetical protein